MRSAAQLYLKAEELRREAERHSDPACAATYRAMADAYAALAGQSEVREAGPFSSLSEDEGGQT